MANHNIQQKMHYYIGADGQGTEDFSKVVLADECPDHHELYSFLYGCANTLFLRNSSPDTKLLNDAFKQLKDGIFGCEAVGEKPAQRPRYGKLLQVMVPVMEDLRSFGLHQATPSKRNPNPRPAEADKFFVLFNNGPDAKGFRASDNSDHYHRFATALIKLLEACGKDRERLKQFVTAVHDTFLFQKNTQTELRQFATFVGIGVPTELIGQKSQLYGKYMSDLYLDGKLAFF
ncbi:MAG: hypothetical protein SGARI_004640, partial [Bacillariaceae sp.]